MCIGSLSNPSLLAISTINTASPTIGLESLTLRNPIGPLLSTCQPLKSYRRFQPLAMMSSSMTVALATIIALVAATPTTLSVPKSCATTYDANVRMDQKKVVIGLH